MNPLLLGLLGLVLLLTLLLLRMPIGLSMAVTGFLGFSMLSTFKAGFSLLGLVTYQTASSYTLTVIPLFILMGQFAGHSRMGADLYHVRLPLDRFSARRAGHGDHSGLRGLCRGFRFIPGHGSHHGYGSPPGDEAVRL